MMGQHSEALLYYFRLEDQVPENQPRTRVLCTVEPLEAPAHSEGSQGRLREAAITRFIQRCD